MRYIPNSARERGQTLREMGLQSADDLFRDITANLKLKKTLKPPASLSEIETPDYFVGQEAKGAGPEVK